MASKTTDTTSKRGKRKPAADTEGPKARRDATRTASRRVWCIYRFRERFEPPENVRKCRKSGLDFTRDYVGLSAGNEAVGYQQQLAMLSNGDGIEYSLLFGIYRQLVNHAGQRSRAYRGFLLNSANEPLSDNQIGRLLKIHSKTMTRLLRKLERTQLLERVPMPLEWDLSQDELPPKDSDVQKDAGAAEGKKPAKRTKNKGVSADGRKWAEMDANGRKPLKENGKRQTVNGKNEKTTSDLAAAVKGEKKNGNDKEAQGHTEAEPPEQDAQGESRTASPPATTPSLPSMPHESDAGGSGRVIPFATPQGSADLSRAGLTYGRRVYLALGYRWDVDSREAAREIASFASKHDQIVSALSGLSPPAVDALLQRGLTEAAKITRRESNRNRGAVWHCVMDKLAAAAQQRSPP